MLYKVQRRITPACAGNRYAGLLHRPARRDHPRLRGEQIFPSAQKGVNIGSPPLARGTVTSKAISTRDFRITPACAGNSTKYNSFI